MSSGATTRNATGSRRGSGSTDLPHGTGLAAVARARAAEVAYLRRGMSLLADVVAASREVAETSSRSGKVHILADLLRSLDRGEVAISVGLLSGVPRQGRVGIGHSTIHRIETGAAVGPSLTIGDLDRAIAEVQAATGAGSATERRRILGELLGRATADE